MGILFAFEWWKSSKKSVGKHSCLMAGPNLLLDLIFKFLTMQKSFCIKTCIIGTVWCSNHLLESMVAIDVMNLFAEGCLEKKVYFKLLIFCIISTAFISDNIFDCGIGFRHGEGISSFYTGGMLVCAHGLEDYMSAEFLQSKK